MQLGPIARLRVAFVALGVVLLTPLGFLVRSLDQRLEAQRQLRHEVVAERIFDELERELTHVLERESARSSAAYDASDLHPEQWAPFVVGYFKGDARGDELLAAAELTPDRRKRLRWALDRWRGRPPVQQPAPRLQDNFAAPSKLEQKKARDASSLDLLRQLNRAAEGRRSVAPSQNDFNYR